METAEIPRISRPVGNTCEWEHRCCGNTAGMETGAAEIPRGWNLFRQESRGGAFEILPTTKIRVQALEYRANCR